MKGTWLLSSAWCVDVVGCVQDGAVELWQSCSTNSRSGINSNALLCNLDHLLEHAKAAMSR